MSTYDKPGRPRLYPSALVDALLKHFGVDTDKELAEHLGVQPPAVSKIRTGTNAVSPDMVIKIHKMTKWPISRIEFLGESQ